SMRSRVVLPAPFGPTIAAVAPSGILKDASSSSCLPSGSTWLTCATSTCPTRRTVPAGGRAWPRGFRRVAVRVFLRVFVRVGRLAGRGADPVMISLPCAGGAYGRRPASYKQLMGVGRGHHDQRTAPR